MDVTVWRAGENERANSQRPVCGTHQPRLGQELLGTLGSLILLGRAAISESLTIRSQRRCHMNEMLDVESPGNLTRSRPVTTLQQRQTATTSPAGAVRNFPPRQEWANCFTLNRPTSSRPEELATHLAARRRTCLPRHAPRHLASHSQAPQRAGPRYRDCLCCRGAITGWLAVKAQALRF